MSLQQIADHLDRTYGSVTAKAKILGVQRNGPVKEPSRRERDARIKQDRETGMTLQAVGAKYGITGERVRQILSTS